MWMVVRWLRDVWEMDAYGSGWMRMDLDGKKWKLDVNDCESDVGVDGRRGIRWT
jgi:hypothetical protein